MAKQKNILVISLILLAIALGFQFGVSNKPEQIEYTIQGTILPYPKALNNFQLTDHNGNSFLTSNLEDHWSVIFVGYTQCPDICPTTMSVMRQVTETMQHRDLDPPNMIFISVDPDRDTPKLLGDYVKYFNKDYLGVTGEKMELDKFVKHMALFYAKAPGTSGDLNKDDYLIDHSSSLLLINPDGKLQAYLTAPHEVENIINSIQVNRTLFERS